MDNLTPENQLDLFPATEDDFEYLINFKYGDSSWHPIVLQNEIYICIWWDCINLGVSNKGHLDNYEIIRNPNYKGRK